MENETNQGIDYAAVLADLLARRDALDKAIEAVKPLAGQSAPHNSSKQNSSQTFEIRGNSFFGMTIPDAAKKLLGMQRKPLTAPEIAKYLNDGGLPHTSANFANTVGSVLNRLSNTDKSGIVKVGRGSFGLVEWYPGYKRGKNSGKKNGESESDDASDLA